MDVGQPGQPEFTPERRDASVLGRGRRPGYRCHLGRIGPMRAAFIETFGSRGQIRYGERP